MQLKGMSWGARDTLIVAVLAVVGIAIGLAVGATAWGQAGFSIWLLLHPEDALIWAVVGLIVAAGLGVAARLSK
jgi:hypothetical protein